LGARVRGREVEVGGVHDTVDLEATVDADLDLLAPTFIASRMISCRISPRTGAAS
jgi:hypothetical protein